MREPAASGATTIRLSADDIRLFSAASNDRNPLHMSPDYARATPFGEPVAFGALVVLAACRHLPPRPGGILVHAAVEFTRPVYLDIDYQVSVADEGDGEASLAVRDGSLVAVRATLRFRPGQAGELAGDAGAVAPRSEPAAQTDQDLAQGRIILGDYRPDPRALREVVRRYGLAERGLDECAAAALMTASYVVGMEVPGERALFAKLSLELAETRPAVSTLHVEAAIESFSRFTASLKVALVISADGVPLAHGSARTFVRPDRHDLRPRTVPPEIPGLRAAASNRVALVTGASRGLGAALCRLLAAHGCTVYANHSHGDLDTATLRDDLPPAAAEILAARADAASPEAMTALREKIAAVTDRLDILICNAAPPLRPLWLEQACVDRIQAHIQQSVAMTLSPLSAFLPLLAASHGWLVLSSSSAVADPPPEWPHYVAAKAAAEALVAAAAREYEQVGCLIARLPRLRTTYTSLFAETGALAPDIAAAQVLGRLALAKPRGTAELVEVVTPSRA